VEFRVARAEPKFFYPRPEERQPFTYRRHVKTQAPDFPARAFRAPRYWPTWLGLGLIRLGTLLPYRWQLGLGGVVGRLLYHLVPRRRHIVETNLRLCFPEMQPEERTRLAHRVFRSIGIAIFETALGWWGGERRLRGLVHVEGLEHIHDAQKKGRGVILLSAHFTCLEIGGRLLSLHQPFQVVYKKASNPLVEAIAKHGRELHFLRAVQTYDTRGMVKGLKDNLVCWYAMDQDFGRKQSVFVPFMGVMAMTLTTPARLAKMTGAAVVPYFPRRLENGKGYLLTVLPALQDFPTGDDHRDAAYINRVIEEYVRKNPDQYFWAHRRFKTRPPGEKDVYA